MRESAASFVRSARRASLTALCAGACLAACNYQVDYRTSTPASASSRDTRGVPPAAAAALQECERILGHPLVVQVDKQTFPPDYSPIILIWDQRVPGIADDLGYMTLYRDYFPRVAPYIQRVVFTYLPNAPPQPYGDAVEPWFDARSGTIVVPYTKVGARARPVLAALQDDMLRGQR